MFFTATQLLRGLNSDSKRTSQMRGILPPNLKLVQRYNGGQRQGGARKTNEVRLAS